METITRDDARALGLTRYYTGESCGRGHVCERSVCRGTCIQCDADYKRTSPVEKAARRRWATSGSPAAKARNRHKSRRTAAREQGHAPPPHERHAPPRPEDGCCQACGVYVGKAKLWFDHDHVTGAFRAWLCHKCNNAPERVIRRPADRLAVEIAHEARRLAI